jgi:hypothetical protein
MAEQEGQVTYTELRTDSEPSSNEVVGDFTPEGEPVESAGVTAEYAESGGDGASDGVKAQGAAPVDEELQRRREDEVAFSWHASEYVHHHKGVWWYLGLFGALALLTGILWLAHISTMQLWLTVALFGSAAVAVIVYGSKPPRTLLYELTPQGVTIDGKSYKFAEFRSFGVLQDVEWHSIDLEPTKPFFPRLTVLFDDDDFDEIVSHLELHLARVDRQPDLIERASRYLRF